MNQLAPLSVAVPLLVAALMGTLHPLLTRTNLGGGTSMSIHESQSKLWENHVARNPAFAELLATALTEGGFPIAAPELHASLVGVERSLIRVSADPLTYPLHIIMRAIQRKRMSRPVIIRSVG